MKKIAIKIASDGMITAETINMTGHECQKYVKEIESLTDAVIVDSKYKKEFFEENVSVQKDISNVSMEIRSELNV